MKWLWMVTGDEDYEGASDPFLFVDARQKKTKKEE